MLKKQAKGSCRITVGEDKAYDTSDHIAALRRMNVTPHVAQNDSLTKTRQAAQEASMRARPATSATRSPRPAAKWPNASSAASGKGQHGTMRKTGTSRHAAVAADFMLNLIAYNLVRIPKLIAA